MSSPALLERIANLRAFPAHHVPAARVIDVLLDARCEATDHAQRALIDRQLAVVSRRHLLVHAETESILDRVTTAMAYTTHEPAMRLPRRPSSAPKSAA
jgi:hypothetical protein